MTETIAEVPKKPGIVLFAAILNFIAAGFGFIGTALSLAGLIFGNIMGLAETLSRQMNQVSQTTGTNLSVGVNVIFGFALVLSLMVAIPSVILGFGLLKEKKWAWYLQVVSSFISLIGFPFWTIVNAVILVFFFQRSIRDYFKV